MFLFKDGNNYIEGCGLSSKTVNEGPLSGESISCATCSRSTDSCTGNEAYKECVWQITLPDECENQVTATDPIITTGAQITDKATTTAEAVTAEPDSATDNPSSGGSISTCSQQKNCLQWSIEEDNSGDCGDDCAYMVCVTVTLDDDSCIKSSSDSISHTCKKNESCTAGDNGSFSNADEVGNVGSGDMQCQIRSAGDTAMFLFKDGKNDANEGCGLSSRTVIGGPINGESVSCATRSG